MSARDFPAAGSSDLATYGHIPGPWRVYQRGGGVGTVEGKAVAALWGDEGPEQLAAARLIAAAPELLAVVQGLIAWEDQDDIALDPVMEAARAALAKAVSQ